MMTKLSHFRFHMCDSHISESCSMDFTTYCPVDSLSSSEGRLQRHKSQTRSHIAWFSRKTKGLSSHGNKPEKQDNCGSVLDCSANHEAHHCASGCSSQDQHGASQYNTYGTQNHHGACCSCSSQDQHGPYHCNTISDRDHLDSSGDEGGRFGNRSLEKPSLYVSQEELDALKGCVTRRRAVFSPSPSSSPVHSYVHQQSPKASISMPVGGKHLLLQDEVSHERQGSFEYDHLKDYDPCIPVGTTTDSVSVQFRLQGCDESGECGSVRKIFPKNSVAVKRCAIADKELSLGLSPPEQPDFNVYLTHQDGRRYKSTDRSQSKCQNPGSCDLQLVQEVERCGADICNCNSWPRNEVRLPDSETKAASPLLEIAKFTQQNPFKYHSPLPKRQVYSHEGNMRTCDAGSNFSLYSQTTTVSSLADRQHCSYSKGVDGTLFKDRTDVSSMLST